MNDVLKTISERFTCRDFTNDAVLDEHLGKLVDAALASPSALNAQPWHIIVVTKKSLIKEMDEYAMSDKNSPYYERIMERGGKMFYNAPCAIIIAINDSTHAPLDAGIVSQNIALAAHSIGLGSCICGMMRIVFSGEKGEYFAEKVKIPKGMKFGMSVLIGKVKTPKSPHELDKSKVTHV